MKWFGGGASVQHVLVIWTHPSTVRFSLYRNMCSLIQTLLQGVYTYWVILLTWHSGLNEMPPISSGTSILGSQLVTLFWEAEEMWLCWRKKPWGKGFEVSKAMCHSQFNFSLSASCLWMEIETLSLKLPCLSAATLPHDGDGSLMWSRLF